MTSPSKPALPSEYNPSYEDFLLFARANGRLTIWDWMTIPAEWQVLLARAGDQVAAERAVAHGMATTPEGMGQILRPYDGGDTALSIALSQAASTWGMPIEERS